jgi:O-antigen ligase
MLSPRWRPAATRQVASRGVPVTPAAFATATADSLLATDPVTAPATRQFAAAQSNPLRKLALYSGLALLFVELTVLQELASYILGFNPYILYFVAPPAILFGLFTGSLQRTFRHRAPFYWMAFYAWMILATPFSHWPGGSFNRVLDGRISLILLVVVGGLATNWKEIRAVFYTLAAAAVTNLLTARFFMESSNGRVSLGLTGFDIGNSNDLAAQLVLVLPFALFIAVGRGGNLLIRIPALAVVAYGMWIILGTGSRGGLIALAAAFVVFMWLGSMRQRMAVLVAGTVMATTMLVALPEATLTRLGTLFGERHEEAEESGASRVYLFQKSLLFTVQHPVFGVGPDQFSNYEGGKAVAEGHTGSWHATHCAWTQVSSECGIPALIFYAAGLGSALALVMRTFRSARQQGHAEIANACLCYLVGMAGFLVAITFLADAYRFYVPTMISLAVSMSFAASEELSASRPAESLATAG